MKCRFVDAEKAAFPIRRLCHSITLSPQTYYAWRGRGKCARELDDERLLKSIVAIFLKNVLGDRSVADSG